MGREELNGRLDYQKDERLSNGEYGMKISFLGANRLVSGSCYLIQTKYKKFLIDCGLFRGEETITRLNYLPFSFRPEEIDFVILTHAHIDHCGRIPELYKEGFRGPVYCTKSTMELCAIMLPDSGQIQEEDAEEENQRRLRTGEPFIEPLYSIEDALDSLLLFRGVPYQYKINIDENISFRLQDAGHVLGSASIELWIKEDGKTCKWLFSGDIGRKNKPFLKNPQRIKEADYIVIESTYGARKHRPYRQEVKKFFAIIDKTLKRGGDVVIPAFALQRAQDIIYELSHYYNLQIKQLNGKNKKLKKIKFYLDSPLAIAATKIYRNNPQDFAFKNLKIMEQRNQLLDFQSLRMTSTSKASKQISRSKRSKIIISASGMCDGGRIQYHLKEHLWEKKSSIIFVGYQAEGTLGKRIVSGEKCLDIMDEMVDVKAEIYHLDGFSSHGDREELLWWIKGLQNKPKKVFVVHGEKEESESFAKLIKQELTFDTHIPVIGETFLINDNQIITQGMIKNSNKEGQLDEILTDLNTIKHKFHLLLTEMELSSAEYEQETLWNKIKQELDQLQKDIRRVKHLIKENELEV
ncbi:MAG: MBL fold metallo-hydrolase RNA specificity domain-containing protein [Candidatus Caldatribacteriota bacterium]